MTDNPKITVPTLDPAALAKIGQQFSHVVHGMNGRLVEGCAICAGQSRCDSLQPIADSQQCELRAGHLGPHRVEW